ncbi:hypothetical protein [Stenotrophomonas lactitubi]|uniref:hypothetical protein n=1 Tax=Stenotrophomonas lactitubi TaxID=2045214 RepID=UPI001DA25F37|nr:hypothetical protein [Stenotrophomonas lactitubi]CAH0128821.1 hypothetical protein SRABI102_00003 [Stenotrophomonas lactitubi]CAH0132910.1 hypothetical protein SRABI66_00275 [Stenotrophomonas lactitubi]CAH0133333.1 hypothetical protein SRABI81_00286 [Stenotrophomonas lactitubi]CAH0145382.1 hypothetical protein SRABI122_00568 [Stenotrophomonas lactitubi]
MATKAKALDRTFFDLPSDENTQIDTAELLADLAIGGRMDWPRLLESERILIVSEAGMGKTYECQGQQQRLWEEGRSAFFVELATLATDPLERQFSADEKHRFDNWKAAQTERAFFFLDSVDELKLTQRSFETTLKQFAAALGDNLERACVVLTTRPTAFDLNVVRKRLPFQPPPDVFVPEDYFANVAMSVTKEKSAERSTPEWRFVALSALDEKQMRALAVAQGVADPDALLDAVNAHHAHDFAKRPLDFLQLCGDWKVHGRIRAHREQVDSSIDIKLRARGDRPERTQLPPQRARGGAARLALAALLSRKLTLWHSSDNDRGRGDATLDPAKILDDWSEDEVKTLLERPLFGFATYGRVRFHNRSIVEFLAAERLKLLVDRGLPIRALMRLLFATTPEGQRIVKPSLQPVAAWLAPQISTVHTELLEHEPSVLLRHGDPGSLNLTLRTQALERYVHMYGAGGWRGQGIPTLQVQRLATNDFNDVIAGLWAGGVRNPEVRETLLELIGAGQMTECAGIAYGVATDPNNDAHDRLNGLLALAELQDSRLSELLDLIAASSPDWPEDLARSVIHYLFPKHLLVPQLVKTLARLSPKSREIGGVSTMLPLAIAKAKLEPTALAELQCGLAELVSDSCRWHDQYYRVTSGRQDLVPALLVACRRRLEMRKTGSDLFEAIALAGLLARLDHDSTEDTKTLRAVLTDARSEVRAGVFWANDRLVREHYPKDDCEPLLRLHQFQSHGAYQIELKKDADWLLGVLSDTSRPLADRELALEAALRYSGDHRDRLAWLKQLVAMSSDNEVLKNRAKEYLNAVENPGPPPAWQVEDEKRREESQRKYAKGLVSWKLFWRELNNDPETAFSESRIDNTNWNLWRAMEKGAQDRSFYGWNPGFIERVFGKSMVDRFRVALSAAWRKDRPTLKSERPTDQRNNYLMRWRMGLAGLYAESEGASWASKLTAKEADLACRYALLDLNRLPAWLEAVAQEHPAVVDTMIGNELKGELKDADAKHSMLLQDISHASTAIISLFLGRIRSWLKDSLAKGGASILEADKVGRATKLLLDHGDNQDVTYIRATGISKLQGSPEPSEVLFWLPILARLDPTVCVEEMERLAGSILPAQQSQVVDWLSSLFGHGSDLDLSKFEASPELLLRLVRMANHHVRFEDDLNHEGVYSPGPRDQAQRARSMLGNALLGLRGGGAWDIKMQFADDPEVAHYRDRVRAVALEKLAEDWDAVVLSEAGVVQLEREYDFSPTSRVEMAALLDTRLADIEDLLLQDASPRELWATISIERLLRRALAAELQKMARGAYTVNQEAVTGDEKESDIRLASTAAHLEAVIELKIGDKDYSFSDLGGALHTQLVGKYMAPEHRRVGCLLISVSTDRFWKDPATGNRMEFEEVIARLDAEAKVLAANLGYGAFVAVRGLDLRTRKAA